MAPSSPARSSMPISPRPLAFREELVLVTAKRFNNLAALRSGTPESGPTALVFRTGCTYRQRLEQVFSDFGWPSAARFDSARSTA